MFVETKPDHDVQFGLYRPASWAIATLAWKLKYTKTILCSLIGMHMHCVQRQLTYSSSSNCLNRPISVNSQSGGQNNKIVLHLKGLFLSGEKTTIVCPPDWELLKWVYSRMCSVWSPLFRYASRNFNNHLTLKLKIDHFPLVIMIMNVLENSRSVTSGKHPCWLIKTLFFTFGCEE